MTDVLYSGAPWVAVWVLVLAVLVWRCARQEAAERLDWRDLTR